MNRKENFWKRKFTLKKDQNLIGRLISGCFTIVALVFIGVVAFNINADDKMRAAMASQVQPESPIKANPNRDYGEAGFRKVAENKGFILRADVTNGEISVEEKATGKIWYSNPQDRDKDMIVAIKPNLYSQLIVKYFNYEAKVLGEENNYNGSIKKGGMEHELLENGIKFKFSFPTTGVIIPVQYTLCEEGLLAEIVTDEIEELWGEKYLIQSIAFLPFFGAGGLTDEGYLLVPDGSGALIEFNNSKQRFQSYTANVYGRDLVQELALQETVREQIIMPVFGVKCNDNAFLAVITSGDANSNIAATTSRKTSSYNQIYSTATIREYEMKSVTERKWDAYEAHSIDNSEIVLSGKNYSIKYFFLDADKADYSGMSSCYREYLAKQGKIKESALTDKKYVILDLYGAVSIEKYVMGVKRPVVTALTTYNDVCDIVKELKDQGVENLIINYVGALDSGLNNQMSSKASTESVLGSKKEFRKMVDYLEEEGVLLFLETNPIDLYENGNGYKENRDGAKGFFDQFGFQYKYSLDSRNKIDASRWHLLRPDLVPEFVTTFTESAISKNIKHISLARIGEALYGDYSGGKDFIPRTKSKELWEQALQAASEKAEHLMVHVGNVYSVPYADIITDISDSHSNFDMEDQSVPFYQMVLGGDIVLTSQAANTTVDYEYSFLKALETGSSLKFNLINSDVSELVGTAYNDMVSYSYEYWKDTVVDEYKKLQKASKEVAGEKIVSHKMLSDDVSMTVYESGTKVIINYGEKTYSYQGYAIKSRQYLVLKGGAE